MLLHQFLSSTGLFPSKKAILDALHEGKIKVSNKVITNPQHHFDPKKQHVYVNDKPVKIIKEKIYLLLNKPEGYLSTRLTANDLKLHKKSVFDLLGFPLTPAIQKTLQCVGRLDEDSSGLLILTNDGILNHQITNPSSTISKTYLVTILKPLTKEHQTQLEQGVDIDLEENGSITTYHTKPVMIKLLTLTTLEVTITEGKKREVRRMFEAVNNEVLTLERIAIGKIVLQDLNIAPGHYKQVDKGFLEKQLH